MEFILAAIQLVLFAFGIFKVYARIDKKITIMEDKIKTIDENDKCVKEKIIKLQKDVQQIIQDEAIKDAALREVVKDILTPVLFDMTNTLKDYTDVKTSLMTKDLEMMKQENMVFKGDMKYLLEEFKNANEKSYNDMKNHTEKSIDRLIDVIENK